MFVVIPRPITTTTVSEENRETVLALDAETTSTMTRSQRRQVRDHAKRRPRKQMKAWRLLGKLLQDSCRRAIRVQIEREILLCHHLQPGLLVMGSLEKVQQSEDTKGELLPVGTVEHAEIA